MLTNCLRFVKKKKKRQKNFRHSFNLSCFNKNKEIAKEKENYSARIFGLLLLLSARVFVLLPRSFARELQLCASRRTLQTRTSLTSSHDDPYDHFQDKWRALRMQYPAWCKKPPLCRMQLRVTTERARIRSFLPCARVYVCISCPFMLALPRVSRRKPERPAIPRSDRSLPLGRKVALSFEQPTVRHSYFPCCQRKKNCCSASFSKKYKCFPLKQDNAGGTKWAESILNITISDTVAPWKVL